MTHDDTTEQYYSQLYRRHLREGRGRPSPGEIADYMADMGADVTVEGTSILVTWPDHML